MTFFHGIRAIGDAITGERGGGAAVRRPLSQDNLPIMGPVLNVSGVYLSTGHGHSGIYLAAASGRHVAELVTSDETSPLPVGPYLPTRFTTTSQAQGTEYSG